MPAAGDTETSKGSVLVVEDTDYWRQKIEDVLKVGGYEVTTAANRQDAEELLGKEGAKFQVVIVDLYLPPPGSSEPNREEGFSLLRELERYDSVPVVLTKDDNQFGRVKRLYPSVVFLQKNKSQTNGNRLASCLAISQDWDYTCAEGCTGYTPALFRKPFDPEELIACVDQLVELTQKAGAV